MEKPFKCSVCDHTWSCCLVSLIVKYHLKDLCEQQKIWSTFCFLSYSVFYELEYKSSKRFQNALQVHTVSSRFFPTNLTFYTSKSHLCTIFDFSFFGNIDMKKKYFKIFSISIISWICDINAMHHIAISQKTTSKIPQDRTVAYQYVCQMLFFQVDVFEIQAVDLGKVDKVVAGHDGKGVGDGWYLDKILIKDTSHNDSEPFIFPCDR